MNRLQKTVNNVRLGSYLTQLFLYRITSIGGSIPMVILLVVFGVYIGTHSRQWNADQVATNEMIWGACFVVWLGCKIYAPKLKPDNPPTLYQAPPPPPPVPPRATAAPGGTDDPNEATVIGRLDPRLRDILRPKDSGKPS